MRFFFLFHNQTNNIDLIHILNSSITFSNNHIDFIFTWNSLDCNAFIMRNRFLSFVAARITMNWFFINHIYLNKMYCLSEKKKYMIKWKPLNELPRINIEQRKIRIEYSWDRMKLNKKCRVYTLKSYLFVFQYIQAWT